ncbi:MAG: zinc-ribbon domain-containing protein [Prevotella sp.]|nr:zinc-ribbon domain-containing protein [Prevotella sp.]
MYCKKCGTEQKEGQKFCPKCGTPYMNVEQDDGQNYRNDIVVVVEKSQDAMETTDDEKTQGTYADNKTDGAQPLNPNEEKKVLRIAKAGMWIILIAIVLTFVRAGFGFSFWWYLYLIIMAFVAFVFWITSNSKVRESRRLDSNDSYMIKLISWIGAIMVVILYLWGPLNSNYSNERNIDSSNRVTSEKIPSWLTEWKFVCVVNGGGKIVVRLFENGTARMTILDPTGKPLSGSYNGESVNMSYNGNYTVEGNCVYLSFSGTSKRIALQIDEENHRLYGEGGGVFKQSI